MDVYKGAIVTQVFQAIDGEGRLPVGEKILLEYLSQDDDEKAGAGFFTATSATELARTTSKESRARTC